MSDHERIQAARDEWLNVLARDDDSTEADAVARLSTCRTALQIVDERLAAIGYPVHPIVRPFDPSGLDELQRGLEEVDIALPPMLLLVWKTVGNISVLDFKRYRHVDFWTQRIGQTQECTDGVHIDAPDAGDEDAYVGYLEGEYEGWQESGLADDGEPFEFPIAPDDLHKDNISGGDPYGLVPGNGRWDHRLSQFRWRGDPQTAPDGDPDLVSYLRTAVLECGCFPGLLGVDAFETDRWYLTDGLPVF